MAQPLDRRRLVEAFNVHLLVHVLLIAIVVVSLLLQPAPVLADEGDFDSYDTANSGIVIIDTNATVICSPGTASKFILTAIGVNVTNRPNITWAIQYAPQDGGEAQPRTDVIPFSPNLSHTHEWSCPSDLGQWNVTVKVCDSSETIEPCLNPSDRIAYNSTVISVQVGHLSLVLLQDNVTGCRNDTNSSVDVSVQLLTHDNNATQWQHPLRYHFHFKRSFGNAVGLHDGTPVKPIVNSNGELVTNATSVVYSKDWNCANGQDAGSWDVVVAIHDNTTGALLAYNTTRVLVTKYSVDLTLNGTKSLTFSCSSPTPLRYNYTMAGGPKNPNLVLNWMIQGAPNNATPIPAKTTNKLSDSVLHDWKCPHVFGKYTIVAQVLDGDATVDNLLAQDQVEVEVSALLSLDLGFEQNSHNRIRHHPPMAVGDIHFNASNLAVKGVSSGVGDFFGDISHRIVYDFYPDFGTNATAQNSSVFSHTYNEIDTYAPNVSVRVISQAEDTAGLILGKGSVEFTDLELIGYVSELQFTGGSQEFHLDTNGPVVINYTVSCNLSGPSDSVVSKICWNLTLLESNSSMDVPYHHECAHFHEVAHSAGFSHAFNVSGLYSMGLNCSNEVSLKTDIIDITVKDAPVPPDIPVVSYTLPISLAVVGGLVGFAILGFLVYRRRKNRHIDVADFDYMTDWEEPSRQPRSLKEKIIERLGRVCGCLPGPWHWRKSERTARYLSLAMRTNQAEYGATGSFGVSLS